MFLKIEVEGLNEVRQLLGASLLARIDRNLQDALKTSALKVEGEAVNLASESVYTGEFRLGISAEFPNPYTAEIGSSAPHAPFVENDTRPHFPPLAAMADYAHLKLGLPYRAKGGKGKETAEQVGFLIARKISRVGTKGKHIMERAITQEEDEIENTFIKGLEAAING